VAAFAYRESPPAPRPSPLPALAPASAPKRTPRGATAATTVTFVNRGRFPLSVDWLDWEGAPRRYVELAPRATHVQPTYVGHVWRLAAAAGTPRVVVAAANDGVVEID
jgi:hypothetical protein